MPRLIELCPHRHDVTGGADDEYARCRLVEAPFGPSCELIPISRAACAECAAAAAPSLARPNPVVASFQFAYAERVLHGNLGLGPAARSTAQQIRNRAELELAVAWSSPNHPRWTGRVPGLRYPAELLDASISCDTFADHLRNREPFAYLRFGDGEWLSILGKPGRNRDGQDFAPETLGLDLRRVLEYASSLWPANQRFYVGLHAGTFRDAISRHVVECGLAFRVHWVADSLFELGVINLSTLRFLLAVREFRGPKLLVANETLAPIARALNCEHVLVSAHNSYAQLHSIELKCREYQPCLVVCCAGMASEPLLARLHRHDPNGYYVDCGSIFDALVGRLTREYTEKNFDGVLETLNEHYAPALFGVEGGRVE
jgi:hypothetical protein